ncbi:ABC transporter [candidate division KSB3 bacterium]|uniref:ABC transporter n=1 Tax=candidate division KSB3 bacterium TaxID=2044937 RepID=A0A2G6KH35_9BACT|nr:MAG: ABC transporter [candidate division KSB3 bacterium]
MSKITLKNLTKEFGNVRAVDSLNLTIRDGDFLTLLGPSGCGKTTTLRCLSGLEEPDGGEMYIDEQCIFDSERGINVPPGQRELGLVFQNYALWPHMTVNQNIAFGLSKSGLSKDEIARRIQNILALVGLEGYQSRYPHELSGGQQQRVAVARMVVTQPKILLFDEPLSNLDAKLRMTLRAELKRMHRVLEATTVYVTHDQVEAMTLSTRIVVMNQGVIQQIGTPQEVYHLPANLFVADFMGNPSTNFFQASVVQSDSSPQIEIDIAPQYRIRLESSLSLNVRERLVVNVRPEDIELCPQPQPDEFTLRVYTTLPAGSEALTYVHTFDDKNEFVVKGAEEEHRHLSPEQEVGVRFKRGNIYHGDTGELLASFGFEEMT